MNTLKIWICLACIVHKSLEICERCRLRQQNSPTTRKIPLLFGEKSFETVCFDLFILKQALKQTRTDGACVPPNSARSFPEERED
jgi:hypothetical protein